jgi:hypothetical protein
VSNILDGERTRLAMFERPSTDVASMEETVSQKSASNVWVSAYPLQAEG